MNVYEFIYVMNCFYYKFKRISKDRDLNGGFVKWGINYEWDCNWIGMAY